MKCFADFLKAILKDERGAVVIVVAVLLAFVFLGMVAFSVDVGYLYLQRRHQQTTVDAAALAAAWHLPWGVSDEQDDLIRNTAQDYIDNNNLSDANDVNITDPYGCGQKVKVEITNDYSLFFAAAPPIGQTEADVYAMAVAEKEYTFLDLLPFLMLEYDDIIDDFIDEIEEDEDLSLEDEWKDEWNDWEDDRDAFYSLMKAVVPVNVSFWDQTNVPGNFGIADMRDFVDGLDLNGNPNREDIQYILKQGLNEPFCIDENKHRKGRPGFVTSIETSQPKPDGFKLSQRLDRDDNFFVPLVLQGVTSEWTGNAYESFGLEDFIIGHFIDLEIASGNKVMEGELIDVYLTCEPVPDIYKMWLPVLVE